MSTFAEFLHAFIQNNADANTTPLPLMGLSGGQVWSAAVTADNHPQPLVEKVTVTDLPDELVVPRRHPRTWHSTRTVSA